MLKHRLRTLVTAFGVTLGVAVMLGIQLANGASMRGFAAAIDTISGKASLEIISAPLGLDERLIPQMSWLRQYGIGTPIIDAEVLAETAKGSEMLKVIGIDALRDPALRDYSLSTQAGTEAVSGMDLMTLLAVPDTLLVTSSFATKHGLTTGSILRLFIDDGVRETRVVGVIGEPVLGRDGHCQCADDLKSAWKSGPPGAAPR
jgi:hypothetical protein